MQDMEIRVGDMVKFLNETGGGRVTAIIDTHMVRVMTDDGFEVPVLKKELIIPPSDRAETAAPVAAQPAPAQKMSDLPKLPDRSRESTGIYIAWVRQPGNEIGGGVDVCLVNHSPHDVVYNILTGEQEASLGFEYGSLAPGSSVILQEWPGNANELLMRGAVQAMFHPLKPAEFLLPLTAEFRLKAMRLTSDEAFRITPFFHQPAILIYLGYGGEEPATGSQPRAARKPEVSTSFIDRHISGDKEAVVDLHLEQIIDNVKGISPAEALQIQINYFDRALSAAVNKGIEKLVFIHGVGNGILKSEIRKRLQEMESILYFDAPLAHYGVGATEVRIPADVH